MAREITKEYKVILEVIKNVLMPLAGSETEQVADHPPESDLYELALETLSDEQRKEAQGDDDGVAGETGLKILSEDRQKVLEHLADCQACVHQLTGHLQAIAADRKVREKWSPNIFYAAGADEPPPEIEEDTEDGKYRISLHPTDDGLRDFLTLRVAPEFLEDLEGQPLIVFSHRGHVVLHGTVTAGSISRLVDLKLRQEWPFHIHAG